MSGRELVKVQAGAQAALELVPAMPTGQQSGRSPGSRTVRDGRARNSGLEVSVQDPAVFRSCGVDFAFLSGSVEPYSNEWRGVSAH